MKKILVKTLLILSIFTCFSYNTYAGDESKDNGITTITTEKVPGANCVPNKVEDEIIINYECTIEKGFSSVTKMLGRMIKYFTYIAGLGGVLFIVINGIIYSMGGIDQGMKDEAKKRITGTLIGLVLLFLSGVILNLIAPWIYK